MSRAPTTAVLLDATEGGTASAAPYCATPMPQNSFQKFYVVIIALLVTLDLFLLVAIFVRWSVLRRSIVHGYIVSCLLSVMFFCIVSLYEMFQSIYHLAEKDVVGGLGQKYNSSEPTHKAVFQKDAYLKGVLPALLLIMEFNIAALVGAISDGTIFVGRHVEAHSSLLDSVQSAARSGQTAQGIKKSRMVKFRKLKAIIVLSAAWIVPMIFSIPVAFGWNCIEHCICLPMYREVLSCIAAETSGTFCSRVWPPMSRSYVITTTVLFFISLAIMITTLTTTIAKFYKTYTPQMETKGAVVNPVCKDILHPDSGELGIETPDDVNNEQSNTPHNEASITEKGRSTMIAKRSRPPLGHTVKLIIVLTASLVLFILPLEMMWFLDVLIKPDPTITAFAITLAITYLYAASVPVMLLIYMGSVRKACIHITLKCPCFRPTIITKNKSPSKTAKINTSGKAQPDIERNPR